VATLLTSGVDGVEGIDIQLSELDALYSVGEGEQGWTSSTLNRF
jgi:hypothetical protein